MEIFDVLKLISSENKIKIIAHFWNCKCNNERCVTDIQNEMKLSQSSLSKHLTGLQKEGVLDFSQDHKRKYYSINLEFKKEWFSIIDPIVESGIIKKKQCKDCACMK